MTWYEKIVGKVKRRIPQIDDFEDGEFILEDMIEDALTQIVDYANANSYEKRWDNLLVNCVVTLFNYEGNEGSSSREANGVKDTYNSSAILNELLTSQITPYIRPTGYVYSENRFNMPD